jgi:hypothetical protein
MYQRVERHEAAAHGDAGVGPRHADPGGRCLLVHYLESHQNPLPCREKKECEDGQPEAKSKSATRARRQAFLNEANANVFPIFESHCRAKKTNPDHEIPGNLLRPCEGVIQHITSENLQGDDDGHYRHHGSNDIFGKPIDDVAGQSQSTHGCISSLRLHIHLTIPSTIQRCRTRRSCHGPPPHDPDRTWLCSSCLPAVERRVPSPSQLES